MEKAFEILVDSRSRFETGEPGGVWLSMPTTTEQLHEAMKSVGISNHNPQDFFINGFANTEDCPFDVPLEVIQRGSMDELNYLGKLLSMQSNEDKSKFTAAVTLGERAGNLKDLINLAQNLDCYWLYPTVQSEEDYGYYLIDELEELELPEEAKKYFMYEEYGRDAAINDGGRFTEQGYVYNNKNTFTEWYDGRDMPEEYRIMSYPQPPTRPDPSKVEMDTATTGQTATLTAEPPQPRPVIPLILTADKPAEKLKEITDRLEQGISELFESDRYKEYLSVMSKFHNYSVRNTVLIAMQKPDASLIAGFNAWKNEFGRNVKRGEKGIRIIAPSPFKVKKEMEKIDPQTQRPIIGRDGKPVTEEKEVTIPAFKVVAVFDVSQTEGRELPNLAVDVLTGDVDKYKDFFAALEKTSPVPVGFEKIEGGAHGYYHLEEERIALNEGESQLQSLKTLIHEIAHAKLHSIDLNIPLDEQPNRPDRRTREVEAESIAYTVCQHYGLDTSDYSFGYVAGWSSGKELAELKSSLETIRSTAAEIINSVDGYFAELQRAQGKEQEQTEEPEPPTQPQEQNKATAVQLTTLEQKAVEIAQRYEKLPIQDRIDIIAQAFGCTTGKIETSPCTGKWRGTSDMSIKFDNGTSLFIGNHSTPKTKTAKVQNEFVNSALVQYNQEIISAAKETAVAALMQREAKDNAIATQKGLKPYTLLNVEFNDGSDDKISGHKGWYFVTLAVDGKIRAHMETGLNHDIASGKVSENITRDNYFAAGALKDTDVDYVFNNVGFSSTAELYSLHISDEVRERAEKTLAERVAADVPDKQVIEQQTEPTTDAPYYPINETAARRAKDANSFYDYKPGSATAEYRGYVDEALKIAERQKARVDPMYHEKIDSLLDTYARKLAENMNKGYEIAGRVPSILIAGGSNFPVRKKEKQNAAADRNMEEYREIQGLLDKIRSTGMGGISADDPQAVQKLQSKLADLEKSQETMKAVNAYYRKNKTLDGCPHLSPEQIEKLKADMSSQWHLEDKPFASWALSNNNAEIRRVKERIKSLSQQKEIGYTGWEFEGGRVDANTEANRLQIFFDEKPDEATRAELKSNGFRWSPKEEAWQRQLTDNAYYAANYVKAIQPLTGEKPTELQRAHIRAEKAKQEKTTDPEYIYKVHANPRSDSRENLYFLQAYLTQENGMAKIGDVLYVGTPEKCRELMGQLNAGELTQGQVKELYAKAQEQPQAQEQTAEPEQPTQEAEPDKDTFTIYQLKRGDETRDFRFEPYDRLQAAGLAVDPANYAHIYTAPIENGMSLESIFERFNIDHPKDFKGHSLSVSDVVVLHQNGQDTAHYVDSIGYRQVPEFLREQQKELVPDNYLTGEKVTTPRGSFHLTSMSREQMEAAGYGFHHQSEDGKHYIMGNGTQAFAVAAEQPENYLKATEQTTEQNYNMIDGQINNTPTVDELEAKVKAGEQISLTDLAAAVKADREAGKKAKPEKKPSIRAQLKADKERAQKKPTKNKSQDLERS
ncbi:Antirestriction protein (ArdA) [Eubacterium limosum]|uniref:Antirestriction protein (ArdA) n=1 Tax=Eubacterium limosum TaxID=1736 RepID=A0A6N3EXG7_EUBLI